jgi:16S rRNA (guanine966-N2)-methyltransferase
MRIIAGEFKSRAIKAVPGEGTRPTTDRIREAWASTLMSLLPKGFMNLEALDAFAGSGALGIEILSRGAAHVSFCDSNIRAVTTIKENLATIGIGKERTEVLSANVFSRKTTDVLKSRGPLDLIVLDPPYDFSVEKIQGFLTSLATAGCLSPHTIITYEHRVDENLGLEGAVLCPVSSPSGLELLSCKRYGRILIEYLVFR